MKTESDRGKRAESKIERNNPKLITINNLNIYNIWLLLVSL